MRKPEMEVSANFSCFHAVLEPQSGRSTCDEGAFAAAKTLSAKLVRRRRGDTQLRTVTSGATTHDGIKGMTGRRPTQYTADEKKRCRCEVQKRSTSEIEKLRPIPRS